MLAEHKTAFSFPLKHATEIEPGKLAGPTGQLCGNRRAEEQLLLLCVRARADAIPAARIEALLTGDLDWDYIVRKTRQHRITPLVCRTLEAINSAGVPRRVFTHLQTHVHENARFNLFRTGELIRILRLLADAGVSAVPFKGPVLSMVAYGSLAQREYGDLDILVRTSDVSRTRDLLLAHGYHLVASRKTGQTKSEFMPRNKDLIFEDETRSVRIELHWRLTGKHFNYPVDLNGLWDRLETIRLAGVMVPTLGLEDLLLYLCMHGSRHGWERLIWVCDVAELIRVGRNIRWQRVIEQAALLGSERMLGLALLLAQRLLGSELPKEIQLIIQTDEQLPSLAAQLHESLFRERAESQDIAYWYDVHLRVRERVRDRLRLRIHYYRRYLRLVVVPNERDQAMLELPSGFSFLYYLLRPFRLLRRFGLPRLKQIGTSRDT